MIALIASGLLFVGLFIAANCLRTYMKETGRRFAWWKWALLFGWTVGIYVTFAFIGTAIGEGEPGAALRGGATFLILLALIGVFIFTICFPGSMPWSRKKAVEVNK